jgi:hypothetical protein
MFLNDYDVTKQHTVVQNSKYFAQLCAVWWRHIKTETCSSLCFLSWHLYNIPEIWIKLCAFVGLVCKSTKFSLRGYQGFNQTADWSTDTSWPSKQH